jgi:outer membrane protein
MTCARHWIYQPDLNRRKLKIFTRVKINERPSHFIYFCCMRRGIKLFCCLFIFGFAIGQPAPVEKWDIVRCVEFALKNNISVKQSDLQSRFSALNYKQDKAGRLPSLNFNGNIGYRFGRSENPTTGVLEDNNFLNSAMQLQSQVTLFNWFSIKNTIEASRFSWEGDLEQTKKVQNDIALNVAIAYLQILLAKEQVNLAGIQISQTTSQLENTRKRVNAGVLPELNGAELEAQLARDSSVYVTAQATGQQFILQMKALLNLDAAVPFDVVVPPVGIIPVESLADLQPDAVYAKAIANMPQQKVNDFRLKAAERMVKAAKGAMYPTISAFGGLGTSYVNIKIPQFDVGPYIVTPNIVTVGGIDYFVNTPSFLQTGEKTIPVGTQFKNNFGQSIGIGISVPIFNGRFARSGWDRSKLQLEQVQLTQELDNMTLKQDIYKAYSDATAALQKFNADKKSVQAAEKAYDFAQKRYALNLLSTYDLINSQNNVQTAKVQALYSQYDYVFKIKLLEFYKGQGIRL